MTTEGMTKVLVLYHPAVRSYAMPEPDDECDLHAAVERFCAHLRSINAAGDLTVHRFYAPSWEAWCQVHPLEISTHTMPLLEAMNPELAKEPTT